MPDAVTDTHALIWYLEDSPRLGVAANRVFDECDRGEIVIYIPTVCLVEIVYLQERGRISPDLRTKLDAELLADTSGLVIFDLTVEVVNALAIIPPASVPDMPDRIIAATALHLNLPLISRDSRMPLTGLNLIW
jgi:PIN domain nuclease of toxin-antitoxin system